MRNGFKASPFAIKGQCTPTIVQKLEGNKECQDIDAKQDAISMLKLIKNVNFKFEDKKVCTFENVITALRGMANITKNADEDLVKCRDGFNNEASPFEQFGNIAKTEAIINTDPRIKQKVKLWEVESDPNKRKVQCEQTLKLSKEVRGKFLACLFVKHLDSDYEKLQEDLSNSFALGNKEACPL